MARLVTLTATLALLIRHTLYVQTQWKAPMKPVLTASPILKKGFTMIELIVVVAIMAMMMGGGIATYSAFRSGKVSLRQAQIVADLLEEAKRSAVAGEKPSECGNFSLTGYSVDISSTNATIVAVCPGGSPTTKVKTLVDTTVTASQNPITFKVLGGGSVDATIDVCSDSHLFRITVTTAGNVTEPAEVAGGC